MSRIPGVKFPWFAFVFHFVVSDRPMFSPDPERRQKSRVFFIKKSKKLIKVKRFGAAVSKKEKVENASYFWRAACTPSLAVVLQ